MAVPTYAELMARTDAPAGSSWGLFADTGDLGTLNFLTPDRVRAAAALIRKGTVINLELPLDGLPLPLVPARTAPEHDVFGNGSCHRDDRLTFAPQGSTHIDGLRHFRHPVHGYYNGASDEDVESGARLGIDRWGEVGIAGRAILLDLPRHLERVGKPPLDHRAGEVFGVGLLDDVLAGQGTERQPGDIVLLRTGWLDHYLDVLTPEERTALVRTPRHPGLVQSQETLAWLWDGQTSALFADNFAVEAVPAVADAADSATYAAETGIRSGAMHVEMLALLGLVIGELWALHDLADACAEDGVYEAFFTAKPLSVRGGVASPGNALAIR